MKKTFKVFADDGYLYPIEANTKEEAEKIINDRLAKKNKKNIEIEKVIEKYSKPEEAEKIVEKESEEAEEAEEGALNESNEDQ